MAEFRTKRFLRLIRILWIENRAVYGISLGITALILFCFAITSEDGSLVAKFYPVMLTLCGSLMAVNGYGAWNNSGRSSFYLLLPASPFEKFASLALSCTLLFIPLFTTAYFSFAYLFTGIFHPMSLKDIIAGGRTALPGYRVFYADTILVYLFLLPIFLYGAARYRKFRFPAVLLILVILFIAYNYWQLFLLYQFSGGLAFGHTFFIRYGDFDYYQFPGGKYMIHSIGLVFRMKLWNILAWGFVSAGLYFAAYHSLKEREI